MNKSIYFIRSLIEEMNEWVIKGLITDEQRIRIEKLYREEEKPAHPESASSSALKISDNTATARAESARAKERQRQPINIARVIIGLASFCLAVGIIIFYAANWRKMPPVAKIIQVVFLIVSVNGLAYLFLSGKRTYPMVGRALLLVGMICYGAGIMLIAQIYHISAEPSTGVLAWAVGALAMSALMRERFGYWLCAVLFFIWNCMEFFTYDNPMFVYVIPVLLLGYLFRREGDRYGMTASAVLFGWYFFQANLYVIFNYVTPGWPAYCFITGFVIEATVLILAGRIISRISLMDIVGKIVSALGILALLLPVIQMSYLREGGKNDLLVWAVSSFASSLILRKNASLYFSMALFFVWNLQVVGAFSNPNWWFMMPIALFAFIAYKMKDRLGLIFAVCMFGWYILQTGVYSVTTWGGPGVSRFVFIASFVALGGVMRYSRTFIDRISVAAGAGVAMTVCGWLMYLMPFVVIAHVNASDAYGMLAFAAAVFIAELILREHAGLYISLGLCFVWSVQSTWFTGVIPFGYAVPLALFAFIFYRKKDEPGILFSSFALVYYIIMMIYRFASPMPSSPYLFMYMTLPLGVFLIVTGRACARFKLLSEVRNIYTVLGWLSFLSVFILISWPLKMKSLPCFISFENPGMSVIYLTLAACAIGLLIFMIRKKEPPYIYGFLVFFVVAMFFVPVARTAPRMVALHLGIILTSLVSLRYSYSLPGDYERERVLGMVFTFSLVVVKGLGFMTYGLSSDGYRLAYLIGFILFAVVIFLVNRMVSHLVKMDGGTFPSVVIDALCAVFVWTAVFMSSFRVDAQRSVFEADRIVIVMIVFFVIIAVLFYGYLLARLREGRVLLYLSSVVFLLSGITLFAANPSMPWAFYSVVFNLLLLVISVVIIYYSTVVQSKLLLNIAIAGFILHVVVRYFDLFWDMLSGSLLFIVTGIIGLAGGFFLERNRRKLIDQMKSPHHRSAAGEDGK